MIHEMRDDFGIGLTFKLESGRLQLAPELFVVLDDAVVHQRNVPAREVWMRVRRDRRTVCGPARM